MAEDFENSFLKVKGGESNQKVYSYINHGTPYCCMFKFQQ